MPFFRTKTSPILRRQITSFPMPVSKAHSRSYTISIRALTPNSPQHPATAASHRKSSHKPTKSTPNAAVMMSTEPFPSLAGGISGQPALGSMPRHNRDLTLRRYLLLQEEHESIRQHLDALSATASSASGATTTTTASPSVSPTRAHGHGLGHKRADSAARRASMPLCDAPRPRVHRRRARGPGAPAEDGELAVEDVLDPSTLAEVASEEARLFAINEGIKRSLTELLNCETVRVDQAFRQWIMARLLEVEKELRVGRRRRSCPSD